MRSAKNVVIDEINDHNVTLLGAVRNNNDGNDTIPYTTEEKVVGSTRIIYAGSTLAKQYCIFLAGN